MTVSLSQLELRRTAKKLDLGSGPVPREGYVGVDRVLAERVVVHDLTVIPWPWQDESIEALASSHCIEHLPERSHIVMSPGLEAYFVRDALVTFFEEAWRICQSGALFQLRWPAPFHPETGRPVLGAWMDPTHYRHIPAETLVHFSRAGRQALGVRDDIRCNWVPTRDVIWTEQGSGLVEYDAELRRED